GVEVAVDDEVQEPVHEGADAVLGQVDVVVPPGDQVVDGELLVLAHRHQRRGCDERGDLPGDELPGRDVQPHGVDGQEVVALVPAEFGTLATHARIIHGQGVQ